jgi:hypothetical protein
MQFEIVYTDEARWVIDQLWQAATQAAANRARLGKAKASKQEGLIKQIVKALHLLAENPRHPGLCTHEFHSMKNPLDASAKVFEAYAQNNTPGAYRIFWCYGPNNKDITIITITAHP